MPIEDLLKTGPLIVAAKESGAGSLLAALLSRVESRARVVAVLEQPADRYFADLDVEIVHARQHADGEWSINLDRLLAETAPARIIVGASVGMTIEKALVDAGQRAGIARVMVVDHYWNLWQRFAGASPEDRWRYQPDVIYVPDPWCIVRLMEFGCPVSDIRVFHHPLLETCPLTRSPEQSCLTRERLGFSRDDTVVLFISEYGYLDEEGWSWDQPPEADIEALAREVLEVVDKLRREGHAVRLLVRRHPAEHRDWVPILAAASRDPGQAIAVVDCDLGKSSLFSVADIAFGLNSMLLAEAARSGLPAYCRFPAGSYSGPKLSDFVRGVTALKTQQDLEAAIRCAVMQRLESHAASRNDE